MSCTLLGAPVSQTEASSDTAVRPAQGALAPGSLSQPSEPITAELPQTPAFHRPDLQALAKQGRIADLAAALRKLNRLHYCPECGQWIANPSYVARHACKMHPHIRNAQPAILQWIKLRGRLSSPCEWCLCRYDRASAHIQACVVLWTCAHMLHFQNQLTDRTQRTLQDVFCRQSARGGTEGAQPVLGLHANAEGQRTLDSPSLANRRPGAGKRAGRRGARPPGHGCGPHQAHPRAGAGPSEQVRGGTGERPALGRPGKTTTRRPQQRPRRTRGMARAASRPEGTAAASLPEARRPPKPGMGLGQLQADAAVVEEQEPLEGRQERSRGGAQGTGQADGML